MSHLGLRRSENRQDGELTSNERRAPSAYHRTPTNLAAQVLLPALTNLVPANLGLLERVGVKTLLYGPEYHHAVQPLIRAGGSQFVAAPGLSLESLLSEEPVPDYPFDKTLDQIIDHPMMMLHTSGTSGKSTRPSRTDE